MKVSELRDEIKHLAEASEVKNGREVWRMPDGTLVSKAKKNDLEAYVATLKNRERDIKPPGSYNPPVGAMLFIKQTDENLRKLNRLSRKVAKYSKRRQTKGNAKTLAKWQNKLTKFASRLV